MKKFLTLFLSLSLLSTAYAQHSYFTASTGYGMGSSKRTMYDERTINPGSANHKAVRGSFGAGFRISVGYQRMTAKNWGWGIDVDYLVGKKTKSVSNSEDFNGTNTRYEESSKSNAVFVIPSITKQFNTTGRIIPHVSFGLVLGAPKVKIETNSWSRAIQGQLSTSNSTTELTHRLAVGSRIVGGIDIPSDRAVLFADIEFITLSPTEKESVLVKRDVNGSDAIAGTTKESRTIQYEKEYTQPTGANTALADTSPFGSLGIRVGVRMYLTKKAKADNE